MVQITEKHLTLVLLDLVNSTKIVQKIGATKSALLFQKHDQLTRSLLYKFNGREIDRSDGFLFSFDSVLSAVNFALWYQLTVPLKTGLNSRIGVHYGLIAEVIQEDKYTLAGAKSVELEGITKNITARIMSICKAKQVLLSKEAFFKVRNRTNAFTPKNVKYACVGVYKFKGVKTPLEIFAVAVNIEYLQPPPSTEKAKRLGGPKKIKSRARDRKLKEWFFYLLPRIFLLEIIYFLNLGWPCLSNYQCRKMWGIDHLFFWCDYIQKIILFF